MTKEGAFFRLEGALVATSAHAGAAYLAGGAPHVRQRLFAAGIGGLAASVAAADPAVAARIAWSPLRGLSRDRIEVLGEDWAQDELLPKIRPQVRRLLEDAARTGRVCVLVSESIDAIAGPVARALGFDDVMCSALEWEGEQATGRLREPRVGPEVDPRALRALAAKHDIDLARSAAYGSRGADSMLLSLVGLPCAVAPDRQLSRIARDLDWPVVIPEAETSGPERLQA